MSEMKKKCSSLYNNTMCSNALVRTMLIFLVIMVITVSFLPFSSFAIQSDKTETNISDAINGDVSQQEEKLFFYGNEKRDFLLESNFLRVAFDVSEDRVFVKELKNVSSGMEWIRDISCTELSAIYYDDKNVMQSFGWKYFGCYVSENSPEIVFEFHSEDESFICKLDWRICNTNEDGSVLLMSHEISTAVDMDITLPNGFSCLNLSLASEANMSAQYLDGNLENLAFSNEKVLNFSIGNSDGFDMSIPLVYFNSPAEHGIAVGAGVFNPEKDSVLNVGASDESIILSSSAEFNLVETESEVVYVLPSLFIAVYDGNSNVGKNLIKNSNVSGLSDKFGSLPLTYDNAVGGMTVENVQELRENFYSMLFYFSVGDACKTSGGFIKDELSLCNDENSDKYKYILRSAVFCDFDYTKVGLTDGTAIKKSAAEHDELYRNRLASIMLSGRQYPIFEGYSSDNWDGIEFYDSVNKKGAIFVFRNTTDSETQRLIAVQGVEPDVEYKVSSVDGSISIERITGAELLSGGLNMTLNDGAMSEIIFIEEADVDFADVKILLFGNELSPLELIAISAVFILIIGVVIVAIIINAEDEYKEKKF